VDDTRIPGKLRGAWGLLLVGVLGRCGARWPRGTFAEALSVSAALSGGPAGRRQQADLRSAEVDLDRGWPHGGR